MRHSLHRLWQSLATHRYATFSVKQQKQRSVIDTQHAFMSCSPDATTSCVQKCPWGWARHVAVPASESDRKSDRICSTSNDKRCAKYSNTSVLKILKYKRPNLTSFTPCSKPQTSTSTRCPSCCHQWCTWVSVATEPRFPGFKSAALTTRPWLLLRWSFITSLFLNTSAV